jgi:predicted NAD/FAD-binding protein
VKQSDRIAIVGAGIAGLTTAHLLSRRHEVTVFEAEDYPGGHAHTVNVEEDGQVIPLDTGFLVYNRRNYPNFSRLLDQLGVATQPSDMSFSFRDERTGFEYGAPGLGRLFAQPHNALRPRYWRMLGEVLRFYREAPRLLDAVEAEADLSLGEYLARGGYSTMFVEQHLMPFAAAIWSAGRRGIGEFPARALVRFFANHGLLTLRDRPQWRTISGGSRSHVARLAAPFRDRIRLRTPVLAVRRDETGAVITTAQAGEERFARVVLACHPDQALAMLTDPSPAEREVLGAFVYAANDVVLHSDRRLLPRRRAAWASWNAHRLADVDDRVTLSYLLNLLQRPRCRRQYVVTLNRPDDVAPASIHGRYVYHHPQYDRAALAAQSRRDDIDGRRHTHYCGAYWGYGFHEDGVVSALHVARKFGEEL